MKHPHSEDEALNNLEPISNPSTLFHLEENPAGVGNVLGRVMVEQFRLVQSTV